MGSNEQLKSPKRVWLSWSSGKDCAYTLHTLRQQPDIKVGPRWNCRCCMTGETPSSSAQSADWKDLVCMCSHLPNFLLHALAFLVQSRLWAC